MQNQNNDKIEVNIFNHSFLLSSTKMDHHKVQEIAHFVDLRMKETFRLTNLSSALKVAILTALNLADELIEAQNGQLSNQLSNSENQNEELALSIINITKRLDNLSDLIMQAHDKEES